MQINIYKIRVRFVRDAKGELEAKPGRVILTIAHNKPTHGTCVDVTEKL